MSSISALNSGITGIQRGLNSAAFNAAKIASAESFNSGNPSDLAKPMVGLITDQLQVEASAKVVKTVDDMLGTLLDIKA